MLKKFHILVSFAILAALLSACGGSSASILENQWQWATMTTGIAQEPVQNPEDYVLVFSEDGTFNGKVDCNSISGTYEMNEIELILTMGPTTLAECGPNSSYDTFMGFLKYVNRYALKENRLNLYLSDGSTWMGFQNGGPAE